MDSIVCTKQTTKMQLAIAATVAGMLCLNAFQLSVSNLLFERTHTLPTPLNNQHIQLTKVMINLESDIVKNFDDITKLINTITNARTATWVIPKLSEFDAKLELWIIHINSLSSSDQAAVTMLTKDYMGMLELVIDNAMKIPGVASVLEPNVTPLMHKLSVLMRLQLDVAA
jgi:hypothetical protein